MSEQTEEPRGEVPKKLSPAERISLYESKAQAYAAKTAHYNKKAGQIKRLLRELGIGTV